MSNHVLKKEEDKPRIAVEGGKAAQRKFEESRKRIRQAMRHIEEQVETNGGVYPLAGGRITLAEILRCAGKSDAYLRKTHPPHLVALKEEVQDFVDRANRLIKKGSRSIRRDITDRVREAQTELDLVRQAYAEAELEHSDALAKLEIAEKTIEDLRSDNLELRAKLSGKTVVQLDSRRKKGPPLVPEIPPGR
jgi:DNA repair exonuclease SbcCD ATPase subunit